MGEEDALKVEDLVTHLGQDGQHQTVKRIYQQLLITKRNELAVTGHDLMQISASKAGPWLGDALDLALEAVIYKKVVNDKQDIIQYLTEKNQIPAVSDEAHD